MGRVSEIREYSPGKAANITIAIENEGSQNIPVFIQTKSFTPAAYANVKVGMKIKIYGHITPSKYTKDGETIYQQDIIADYIEYLESKSVVDAREAQKSSAANN